MSALGSDARAAAPRVPDRRRTFGYRVDVVAFLVRTELATRHRGSVLGWLWALTPPLLQLIATYFLFTRVIPLAIPDYPVFLLTGILAWTWFARSLGDGVVSLEQRRELVRRPGFSSALIPIAAVLVALVDYVLALPVLLIAVGLTTGLDATALLLPLLLLVQLTYCVGLALVVAPLQVYARDVRQLVGLLVTVGFWLTPVFYSQRQIPSELQWLYDVNPMAHLIAAQRQVLLAGELPSATRVGLVAVVGIGALVLGAAVFHRCRNTVPERL